MQNIFFHKPSGHLAQKLSWLILLLLCPYTIFSQAKTANTDYNSDIKDLVGYTAYVFNLLGSPDLSARDKETIIYSSYSKIFRDAKVQIEDDLDENRETVTNKDVQAYLKDIDFFFSQVSFQFRIEQVEQTTNDAGETIFIVEAQRDLKGTNISGNNIANTQQRFIEINLDPLKKELKIASIYTSRLSEKEELTDWWNSLEKTWIDLFSDRVIVYDTIQLNTLLMGEAPDSLPVGSKLYVSDQADAISLDTDEFYQSLRRLLNTESLDLSGHASISSITPLSAFRRLRNLNIASTRISNLYPIRNLMSLEYLDISYTLVEDLEPLRYSANLRTLDMVGVAATDITPVSNLSGIQNLDISFSKVRDIAPLTKAKTLISLKLRGIGLKDVNQLRALKKLQYLDVSENNLYNLDPLAESTSIEYLAFEKTYIFDLAPLAGFQSLQTLQANQSRISDLSPLKSLPNLKRIYCDGTAVSEIAAQTFMKENQQILVVYRSAALQNWWQELSPEWRRTLTAEASKPIPADPSPEQLQEIASITHLDLNNQVNISDFKPLSALSSLVELYCANTPIEDLMPLSEMANLKTLDVSGTRVSNLKPIQNLIQLTNLNIAYTKVTTLEPLSYMSSLRGLNISYSEVSDLQPAAQLINLEKIVADGAPIRLLKPLAMLPNLSEAYFDDAPLAPGEAFSLISQRNDLLLVYQTQELDRWYGNMEPAWKDVFQRQMPINRQPDRKELHKLAALQKIELIGNKDIRDVAPLSMLTNLRQLKIVSSFVTDLSPIAGLRLVTEVDLSQNPITSLESLKDWKMLEILKIGNTRVEDLSPVRKLYKLRVIDCSGTSVNDLAPLAGLKQLERLSCNNTDVKKLDDLENLKKLILIECYGTRVNSRRVDKFKENFKGSNKLEVIN